MLAALTPTGIRLSDSVTTQMPVPVHKGSDLSDQQKAENKNSVISGWRVHFDNVTRSMIDGFYQSWTFTRTSSSLGMRPFTPSFWKLQMSRLHVCGDL